MSQRDEASPPLQGGATITVIAGGETRPVAVDRVTEGLIWIATSEFEALQPGEVLEVEIGIRGDARYRTKALVAIAMRDFVGLRIEENWDRRQLREFVRINTYGHRVELSPQENDEDDTLEDLPLIDLSAGGARVAEDKRLKVGEVVLCRFLLGTAQFELVARVVRVAPASAGERRFVSLQFEDVNEKTRGNLIGWVNQEQLRRRTELRDRSRGSRPHRDDDG